MQKQTYLHIFKTEMSVIFFTSQLLPDNGFRPKCVVHFGQ